MSNSFLRNVFFAAAFGIIFLFIFQISAQQNEKNPDRKPFQVCKVLDLVIDGNGGIASDGRTVYAALTEGKIAAVDISINETIWIAELGGSAASSPVVADGVILIAMSVEPSPRLFALSSNTGLPVWSEALPAASRYFLYQTAIGGLVISDRGDVLFFNTSDGKIIRRSSLGGVLQFEPAVSPHGLMASVVSGPVIASSVTGETLFRKQSNSPVAAGLLLGRMRAVYSDSTGRIHAINAPGGKSLWRFKTGGRVTQLLAVHSRILAGSADNFLYLLDSDNGSVRWKTRLPGRIEKLAVIDNETIAATVVGERQVFVIEAENGRLVDGITVPGDGSPLNIAPVFAAGRLVIASTTGLAIFSPECGAKIQTAGRRKPAV